MIISLRIRVNRVEYLVIAAGVLLAIGSAAQADDGGSTDRNDAIVAYAVDRHWPARPSHVAWGHMPGVAVDGDDRVWLFTRAEPSVQVYDADGAFVYSWGGGDAIGMAHHIEIDPKGNVWLADVGLHVVMQFTPEGKLLQTLGTRGEAGLDDDHFNMPTDMAITPKGDVFIADGYGNSRVVHYDARGRFVKAWGRRGDGPGEFNEPHAIAIDSTERIYVADRSNGRVQVFDQSGKFLDQWPNVVVPWGLWITPNDEIWVCGSTPAAHRNPTGELGIPPRDQVFMRFDPSGRLLQMWAVPSGTNAHDKPGELNWVHGIALDSKGNIYAGDIMGQRAQKFIRQIGK